MPTTPCSEMPLGRWLALLSLCKHGSQVCWAHRCQPQREQNLHWHNTCFHVTMALMTLTTRNGMIQKFFFPLSQSQPSLLTCHRKGFTELSRFPQSTVSFSQFPTVLNGLPCRTQVRGSFCPFLARPHLHCVQVPKFDPRGLPRACELEAASALAWSRTHSCTPREADPVRGSFCPSLVWQYPAAPMEPGLRPQHTSNVLVNLTISLVTTSLDIIFQACWLTHDALLEARLFALAEVALGRGLAGTTGWATPQSLVCALEELAANYDAVAMRTFPVYIAPLSLWACAQSLWEVLRMDLVTLLRARTHDSAFVRFAWLRQVGLTPFTAPLLAPPRADLSPNCVFNLLWETLWCSYAAFSFAHASLVTHDDLWGFFDQSFSLRARALHGPANIEEVLHVRSLVSTIGSLEAVILRRAYENAPIRHLLSDPCYWILRRYLKHLGEQAH